MKEVRAEIKNIFVQFLANNLSLDDFRGQVALLHWSIERIAPDMSRLVYSAVGKLSELSLGHRTEDSLRMELAKAIRPFVEEIQPRGLSIADPCVGLEPTNMSSEPSVPGLPEKPPASSLLSRIEEKDLGFGELLRPAA